jgi:CBS domain-containing protein
MIDHNMPLSEIMTTELLIARPTDNVKHIADIFRKKNIHHIPVVDEDSRLVGIVSKSDFLKISHGMSLFRNRRKKEHDDALHESLLVRDIMTRDVAHLGPNDPISLAVGIFRENLFHAIPVIEKGLLVGIITTYDLLTYAFHDPAVASKERFD